MTDQTTPDPTTADTAEHAAPGADAEHTPETTEEIVTGDDALRREVEASRERTLRVAAEFDNFRKRAAKERQEAGWRAQGDLVRGLLDALDDLQRFAAVDPSTVDSKAVVDGIGLVEKKIVKSLAGHGFEVVNPIGHPFDPNLHEALGTAPASAADEDGLVATVYQVGYVINGHLLRPARVVVKQWTGTPAA
jgi:molecular chaperone GrpE